MKLTMHIVIKFLFLAVVWLVFTFAALSFYGEGLHVMWRGMYLMNAFPYIILVYFMADYVLRKKSLRPYRLKQAFMLAFLIVTAIGVFVLFTPSFQYYLSDQYYKLFAPSKP